MDCRRHAQNQGGGADAFTPLRETYFLIDETRPPDGRPDQIVISPDPGRLLVSGRTGDHERYRIPTLWNVRNTAPYFHNNSARTLEEVIDHHAHVFAAAMNPDVRYIISPEERAAILAYLRLL